MGAAVDAEEGPRAGGRSGLETVGAAVGRILVKMSLSFRASCEDRSVPRSSTVRRLRSLDTLFRTPPNRIARADGSGQRRDRDRRPQRAGAFARSPISPGRPSFTDHFLTGFHLTRIDSSGVGAGARFRLGSPLRRRIWMDTAIDRGRRAPPDRRARPRRARQPDPDDDRLGAARGARLADPVRVSHWTEPSNPVDRVLEVVSGNRVLAGAGLAGGAAPPARPARVRRAPARAGSPSPGQSLRDRHSLDPPPSIDFRPPMSSLRRLVLPLLAALALAALSRRGFGLRLRRATPRTSSRANRSKLGGIHYNVIFSRYLNPNDNEDAAYLVGQPPTPPEIDLLRRLLRSPERKRRNQKSCRSHSRSDDAVSRHLPRASPAKASTPSRSAAKSNPRNRSRCSTRPPQQGPIAGLPGPLPAARRGL